MALLRILALILSCLLAAGCAAKTAGKTAPEPPKETVFDLAAATLYSTKAYIYEASAPGPVIMIVGGVHGDEPAGSLAAEKFCKPPLVKGTLIVIPRANNLALLANRRTLPEITDLNRAYPGSPDGNPARRLAHDIGLLMEKYRITMLIDLHEARVFHHDDETSLGQTIIYGFDDKSALLALAIVEHINGRLSERRKKFTFLASPVKGSTAFYASTHLNIPAFTIETSKLQPLADRIDQHAEIVRYLLTTEGLLGK